MKEIKNVYIVSDKDKSNHEYISKVLVEYTDKQIDYYLNESGESDIIEDRKVKEQEIETKVNDILENISEKEKVHIISSQDELLRRYVEKTIDEVKKNRKQWSEGNSNFYEITAQGISLSQLLKSVTSPSPLLNVAGSLLAISASLINHSRKNMPKKEPEWLRKLRFGLSMGLLALNISQISNNLSVAIDNFLNQKFRLEAQVDPNIIKQHQIIIDSLDNPFKDGNMITPTDAAVNVLMEAFDLNPLIEEQDRQIANNLKQYIRENPYLDYEKCYESFASFDILKKESNDNIGGRNYGTHIEIYNNTGHENSQDSYKKSVQHELVHYTGYLENPMLKEGMTALICSEYMDNFKLTSGYYDEVLVTKIFCELITPEKMLEAYSDRNMKIIEVELQNLGLDSDKYQSLIELMNDYSFKLSKCTSQEEIKKFYAENAPKFQKSLLNYVATIFSNANLSQEQKERIVIYLSYIGKITNVNGTIYFNKSVEIPGYVKAYSILDESEMNIEHENHSY